ncbi:hypothetical protein KJ885_04630 [Patescibacteria group bacterium]|nr:hypothetical protein [Patescibacteria group bacterium]
MLLNETKLRKIAIGAVMPEKRKERLRKKREYSFLRRRAIEEIKNILNSIPRALEEAAKNAKKTEEGIIITAKIHVVSEKYPDFLEEQDKVTLRLLKKWLKTSKKPGLKFRITVELHGVLDYYRTYNLEVKKTIKA